MGTWQGANAPGGGSGLSINGVPANVIWTVTPSISVNSGAWTRVDEPHPRCTKHRLGYLDLVGDEVQGTCAGCGERVVIPHFPEASKLLVRVLSFNDRLVAVGELEPDDRRRAVANMLGDFLDLVDQVERAELDMGNVRQAMRIIKGQIATFTVPGE